METTLIFLTGIYCFIVIAVLFAMLKPFKYGTAKQEIYVPFVSVIIAARNEARRIVPSLENLSRIKYPPERYEIIFIDDRSEDTTADIIESFIKGRENCSLIRINKKSEHISGKKYALNKGIEQAKGEIILNTDADCIVPPDWIREMVKCFSGNVVMVLGYSLLIKRNDWLDKLLRFDNLFSGIMIAAPASLGLAMSSVGRNIAFRKEAYIKSGGYQALAKYKSGDDVHLTELFRKKVPGKIIFNVSKNSFTQTKTPDSLNEVLHQQLRKNSKLLKKSIPSIALTTYLFLFHVVLFIFPFIQNLSTELWFLMAGLKLGIEFTTLLVSVFKLNDPEIIPYIPLMQIFYPVYVIVLGIIGAFQKFRWKD